jgi:hypothetical protein
MKRQIMIAAVAMALPIMIGEVKAQSTAGTTQWLYEQCKSSDPRETGHLLRLSSRCCRNHGNTWEYLRESTKQCDQGFCHAVWRSWDLFSALKWRRRPTSIHKLGGKEPHQGRQKNVAECHGRFASNLARARCQIKALL